MLRSALALLSMLQVGGRIRQSFDRLLWQSLIIAVAALLFVAAAVFALLAVYRELASVYQPAETAVLMALALTLLGLLSLGSLQLLRSRREAVNFVSRVDGNPIQATLSGAVRQIGPLSLVLIAFVGGILAGRR
jgi:hypothetical protein